MHPLAIKARKEQLQTLQVRVALASLLDPFAYINVQSNVKPFRLFVPSVSGRDRGLRQVATEV